MKCHYVLRCLTQYLPQLQGWLLAAIMSSDIAAMQNSTQPSPKHREQQSDRVKALTEQMLRMGYSSPGTMLAQRAQSPECNF